MWTYGWNGAFRRFNEWISLHPGPCTLRAVDLTPRVLIIRPQNRMEVVRGGHCDEKKSRAMLGVGEDQQDERVD